MSAQKFRKRPAVVEAIRFDGHNVDEVYEWSGHNFDAVALEDRGDDPDVVAEVYDKFHSTWVGVKVGQWIIRGVQGEYYPIDPDVLAATYDPA